MKLEIFLIAATVLLHTEKMSIVDADAKQKKRNGLDFPARIFAACHGLILLFQQNKALFEVPEISGGGNDLIAEKLFKIKSFRPGRTDRVIDEKCWTTPYPVGSRTDVDAVTLTVTAFPDHAYTSSNLH